jgi:hypothetical protein
MKSKSSRPQQSNHAMNMRAISQLGHVLICAGLLISARAQQVSIPDPGLNAAIRAALQKPTGPLTEQDLLSLTNLNASQRNVSSLQGAKLCLKPKISSTGSSRNRILDLLPIGTEAIVLCDDYLCLGLKHSDGLWRDKQGQVLEVDRVEGILSQTKIHHSQSEPKLARSARVCWTWP